LLYAAGGDGKFKFIRSYPVVKASGELGPKLQEGDGQVPEGLYKIESLNPNSRFHLSLRVDYPNAFDRAMGKKDGRTELGGDIMIHGSNASIGCLAMGDEAAEDLFVLAQRTGLKNIAVILTPVDFRACALPKDFVHDPPWVKGLYEEIRSELSKYPAAR
jgi:murein L,D-transpeptidase YafK